ncbi:hypothetical protein P8452_63327 [Trifolium repens]|nr:hypothetical protein P8452_63327 [Trifolium repens]
MIESTFDVKSTTETKPLSAAYGDAGPKAVPPSPIPVTLTIAPPPPSRFDNMNLSPFDPTISATASFGALSRFSNLDRDNMDDLISELPDEILSYILTMLSMKDLLKTSILSRRWCKLWGLRKDLYFDINNVFGSEEELIKNG